MPVNPWALDGLTLTGLETRNIDTMTVMGTGTALGARSGVRPGDPGLTVTLAGSTINVSAGSAAIGYSGQGVYRVAFPSSVSPGTLTAAHATLPRIDLVYVRVWDNAVDASGLAKADIVYLAGTAASSPVAPTPAGTQVYMPLATISVPASGGGSPTVSTSVRPVTVAPGGIVPDASATGLYAGQYRDDGTGLQRWSGSAWSYATTEGVGKTIWRRKPGNTSRASTATLTADPHLSAPVVANAEYRFDFLIIYDGDSAADLKVGLSAPAGCTGVWWPGAMDSSGSAFASSPRWGAIEDIGTSSMAVGCIGSGTALAMRASGTLVVAATAGTFALTWAQNSGSPTATVLHQHSSLLLQRVA
jgi:hypothetical protein